MPRRCSPCCRPSKMRIPGRAPPSRLGDWGRQQVAALGLRAAGFRAHGSSALGARMQLGEGRRPDPESTSGKLTVAIFSHALRLQARVSLEPGRCPFLAEAWSLRPEADPRGHFTRRGIIHGQMLQAAAIILCLILLTGLYVAAEFAAVGIRRSRLRRLSEDGHPLAARLLPVLEGPQRARPLHRGVAGPHHPLEPGPRRVCRGRLAPSARPAGSHGSRVSPRPRRSSNAAMSSWR